MKVEELEEEWKEKKRKIGGNYKEEDEVNIEFKKKKIGKEKGRKWCRKKGRKYIVKGFN